MQTNISNKWPHVIIRGPSVPTDKALEYIARTDYAFRVAGRSGNDDDLARFLQEALGFGYMNDESVKALRYVRLEHLDSHWISCCYIGGTHGPVHPDGTVAMQRNFGKWPSVEEVEADLELVALHFPWLSFDLHLWDNSEGQAIGKPDFAWKLECGKWWRVPGDVEPLKPVRSDGWLEVAVQRIGERGYGREQYFSRPEILRLIQIAKGETVANNDAA
jgi:hypothetical protein